MRVEKEGGNDLSPKLLHNRQRDVRGVSGTTGRAAKTRSGSETKAAQNKTMGHLDRNVLPELFVKGNNENGCQDLFCDLLQLHGTGVGGLRCWEFSSPNRVPQGHLRMLGSPPSSQSPRWSEHPRNRNTVLEATFIVS